MMIQVSLSRSSTRVYAVGVNGGWTEIDMQGYGDKRALPEEECLTIAVSTRTTRPSPSPIKWLPISIISQGHKSSHNSSSMCHLSLFLSSPQEMVVGVQVSRLFFLIVVISDDDCN